MVLVDSDDVIDEVPLPDTTFIKDGPMPLTIATNDKALDVKENDDIPKAPQDEALTTRPSDVTASTDSMDDSPIHSGGSSDSPEPHLDPFDTPESLPSPEPTMTPITTFQQSDTPPVPSAPPGSSAFTVNTINVATKTLYSLRLPGVGKVLAFKSDQSCDIDTLYEQRFKACDVDAFVGKDGDDNTDDDDDSSELSGEFRTANKVYDNDGTMMMDLEAANNHSTTSIVRRIDPPLDPHCDPFAQRVGKKLSWRNVNMTLVRRFYFCWLYFFDNIYEYGFTYSFITSHLSRKQNRERKSS